MPALKKMVATVDAGAGGAKKYFFMSNPLLYTSIGAAVGIAPAATTDTKVVNRIEDLLLYGILVRKVVRVGTGVTKKSVRILCSANKEVEAEQELLKKTIPQGTITSVSAGLNASYYL